MSIYQQVDEQSETPQILELTSDSSTNSARSDPAGIPDHSTVYIPISDDEGGSQPVLRLQESGDDVEMNEKG